MKLKQRGYIALLTLIAATSLVSAIGAITSYVYDSRVLPRTIVAGVSIGNLPYSEAVQKVTERENQLAQLNISFPLNDQSANTTLEELGVKVDEQSVIAK